MTPQQHGGLTAAQKSCDNACSRAPLSGYPYMGCASQGRENVGKARGTRGLEERYHQDDWGPILCVPQRSPALAAASRDQPESMSPVCHFPVPLPCLGTHFPPEPCGSSFHLCLSQQELRLQRQRRGSGSHAFDPGEGWELGQGANL